jgi:hypothetical protein
MNYFAHGRRFVDDPYFLAGTALPDWMNVVDRRARVRRKHAAAQVDHADPNLAAVARGVVQHHDDDDWFHRTTAFFEVSQQLTVIVAGVMGDDERARPSFLGHILTEVLLDAGLIAAAPDRLNAYYAAFDTIQPEVIERAVEMMNGRRLPQITQWVPRFTAEGFLRDYGDDERLCYRLNQVMRRVGLPQLSDEFAAVLPGARDLVAMRQHELLTRPDGSITAAA